MNRKTAPIHRIWIGIFGAWALFLSGALTGLVGSPGVVQVLRLRSLLAEKQAKAMHLESEITQLELDRERLDKSKVAQEHEVRKVLGYAAPDEIIFDFSAAERRTDPSPE